MKTLTFIITCALCFTIHGSVLSQPNFELNKQIRTESIVKLSVMLKDYVYPEVGIKVSNKLNKNLNDGKHN